MCVGLPMCVREPRGTTALCEAEGQTRLIDMSLVGDVPAGTWVLVFIDAAREVVSAEHAAVVTSALKALDLAMSGAAGTDDIDRLFPDLANRVPELPDHLKAARS